MKVKTAAVLMLLLLCMTVQCKELVKLKPVPLMTFMQNDLVQSYPISILVPAAYEGIEFEALEPGKYYWMRSKDAEKAKKKQDLPTRKGFMYGKITMNVGYDIDQDLFIGIEDEDSQKNAAAFFENFSIKRFNTNGYPALLVKMVYIENNKPSYLMYIATKISSNVISIAYIPPKYSERKGDYVWERQLAHMTESTSEDKQSEDRVNEN